MANAGSPRLSHWQRFKKAFAKKKISHSSQADLQADKVVHNKAGELDAANKQELLKVFMPVRPFMWHDPIRRSSGLNNAA